MRSTALGAAKAIIFISDAHEKFCQGKLNTKAECLHEGWQTIMMMRRNR